MIAALCYRAWRKVQRARNYADPKKDICRRSRKPEICKLGYIIAPST